MQYFIDKLKEFLVFLVFSRLVQGVVGTRGQITFCQGLQGLCSTPAVRPYTVPAGGGVNEGE